MLTISNLTVATGKAYQVVPTLRVQIPAYIDRKFVITTFPALLDGATYIRTANEDKSETGPNFLTFEVNEPVTVYVGHDSRIATRPLWLSLFMQTGQHLTTNDARFPLYSKDYPAGNVVLGANDKTMDGSMYVVAVQPHDVPVEPDQPVEPVIKTVHISFSMAQGETVRTFSGDLTEEV